MRPWNAGEMKPVTSLTKRGAGWKTAAALALAGCSPGGPAAEEEVTRFRIGDTRYAVPAYQVHSIKRDPPGFIRIHDPESPLELVFDARLQGRTDPQGVPLLFSVNDGNYPRISRWRTKEGEPVACREAAASPRGGCGTPLRHRGATWSVLFPRGRMGQADRLRARAEHLLDRYRR